MGCKAQIDFPGQIALVRQSAHMSSIAQDAAAGRRLELETMFLAPLRMAREHGVATPTLDLLGRGWLERLQACDRRIMKLAAHRQRMGLKPRSERYKGSPRFQCNK